MNRRVKPGFSKDLLELSEMVPSKLISLITVAAMIVTATKMIAALEGMKLKDRKETLVGLGMSAEEAKKFLEEVDNG